MVRLLFWRMCSIISLTLLPGLPWPGVMIPFRVSTMGQIGLFKNYLYLIGPCAKKTIRNNCRRNVYMNLKWMWLFFYLIQTICTQLYGFKYSYLIQIICTQLYGFKYSYLMLIIIWLQVSPGYDTKPSDGETPVMLDLWKRAHSTSL